MDAAKAVDVISLLPGNSGQMSDATQAYTQARLKGKTTWVRLPEHAWPAEWKKNGMHDPVVPLVLALYGHPDAGG
eukprot:13112531-Alexandrium_andersonii.AAC.1